MQVRCTVCKTLKDNSEFYVDSRRSNGLQSSCKDCFRIRVSVYARSFRGMQTRRERDRLNRASINKRHRDWLKTNSGKVSLRKTRNTEAFRLYRREYEKNYYQRPIPRERKHIIFLRYRERKRLNDDRTVTQEATNSLLFRQKHKCKTCSVDLRTVKRHLDHIYPLSKGGRHTITNIQWLCGPCNIRKSNRV